MDPDTFPARLRSAGPRVLKQNRGNDGQGVWKVELVSGRAGEVAVVRVLEALRGSVPAELPLREFIARWKAYFADDGCIAFRTGAQVQEQGGIAAVIEDHV